MPWRLLALSLVALQPACLQIPSYSETGCGDSILGAGEDCDGRYVRDDGVCAAPSSEHACHYICSSDIACPVGWGCGVDGRCYQPRSQLALHAVADRVPIRVIDVIDMDDDGFGDLFGTIGLSLSARFSDGSGRFDTVFNLAVPSESKNIWVAPLDEDARSDVLIPLGPALLALSGQETRDFASRLFPTEIVPQAIQEAAGVALEADRERVNADSELLVLSQFAQPGGTALSSMAFHPPRCGEFAVALPDGQQVSNLNGKTVVEAATRIPRADLDGDRFTEFALAFRGSRKLYLYGSADSASGTDPATCLRPVPYAPTPEIATPDGFMLSDHDPLFVDIDGDTDLDVLMGLAAVESSLAPPISTTAVAVAEALGDGTYETQAAIVPGLAGLPADLSPLLAAGDLDGDGAAEYVMSGGIVRIDQPPDLPAQRVPLTFPRGAAWVTAEVLDVNGDGALDVVAAAPGGLDWFLNATPTGLKGQLNRFILDAPPGEPQLRTGDFNGDLRPDVAVVAHVGAMRNELVVVFGSPTGVPGEVQPIGGFGGRVHFVETGLTPELGASVVDGLHDLFLWTSTDPAQEDQPTDVAFFALQGSTSQRLLSPFPVVREGSNVVVAAVGNFAVPLSGVGGVPLTQRGVMVVSKPARTDEPEAKSGVTLLISTRPGELRPIQPEPVELPLPTFEVESALWLVGDVAPDESGASDELVGIETSFSDQALTIVVMSVTSSDRSLAFDSIELPAEYRRIAAARLVDVDLDGRPDLVLILARNDDLGQVEARILWNEGCPTSRFCIDGDGSTLLPVPSDDQGRPLVGQPMDVVTMQLEGDERRELVVLYAGPPPTPEKRQVFSFADREGDRNYTWNAVTLSQPENRIPRYLAAGDVNGDGLDDLVLDADPFVSVFLQEPAVAEGTRLANRGEEESP